MHNEDKPRATQTHVLKANNLDLGHEAEIERLKANQRKRPPPASGKPDGLPPLFDEATVRAAQHDLRNALTNDARLRNHARALTHVVAYLNGRGLCIDRTKQGRTVSRHIVNPVLGR